MSAYDRWLTTPPEGDNVAEDYIGERVVNGTNEWGLGHWGTIDYAWVEEDGDEDGMHSCVMLEVRHAKGVRSTMTLNQAEEQLDLEGKWKRAREAREAKRAAQLALPIAA